MSLVRTLVMLLLVAPLGGCNGAIWGNLAVLAVTVGIFVGTLSLGRSSAETTRSADGGGGPTASHS
ncbi:MAG: hypothetical protein ACODAU_05500 [Myxococcota bacterium]